MVDLPAREIGPNTKVLIPDAHGSRLVTRAQFIATLKAFLTTAKQPLDSACAVC
ncbi:MAG: hypothetical protein WED05_11310 [Candidatus Atabeyarchaeum deiterrae]